MLFFEILLDFPDLSDLHLTLLPKPEHDQKEGGQWMIDNIIVKNNIFLNSKSFGFEVINSKLSFRKKMSVELLNKN